MLKIAHLSKHFPGTAAPQLDGLSLTVPAGQSVSIQGASGCGKSTLLSLIAGFELPDSGDITFNDTSLIFTHTRDADAFRRQQLGVVFQSFNLLDCLSVWDNIAFPARLKGNPDDTYQRDIMHQLDIAHLETAMIGSLSGGEQQRVAIARALAHRPALLLADEPTGNLDEATSERVTTALIDTCRHTGTTLMLVTHASEVADCTDVSYRLHNGQLQSNQSAVPAS
ncbi:ABC transporter ATP-binding protein [Alteromonas halophila]|uniref:ABC transporter ATP-binding protein n=1 Tax=Alteromonas halophila TaxID=516698 RepID=A0A918JMA4_9ALTE|nr:ABC transporter ATP-binding protein [Alteromonas halophila]GGW86780.1 ABC transporter ATP-binding protein [Alteromonas halophila]